MIVTRIAEVPVPTDTRGFVPTMGALHEGHLSLVRKARDENKEVVVSIFVNPTQFGPNEDYARYPRDLDKDAQLALDAGADWIFAPDVNEMYPRMTTVVSVKEVTETYEGAMRPGHFDGVSTVVLKLFNIIKPSHAYFGLKDLQQCQVIRRMVEDLNVPVVLRFCETAREPDGLAMSSRNAYLSREERAIAPALYRELSAISERLYGKRRDDDVKSLLQSSRNRLRLDGFEVDYLDLIDLETMHPSESLCGDRAVAVAAKLGKTRLIDNVLLNR